MDTISKKSSLQTLDISRLKARDSATQEEDPVVFQVLNIVIVIVFIFDSRRRHGDHGALDWRTPVPVPG